MMENTLETPPTTRSSKIPPCPPLSSGVRCALKARAHHLPPAVMIGQHGLTENVLKAIEKYLSHNDLIKVRVLTADQETRVSLAEAITQQLHAQLVQHIGRQLIFFRPLPKKKKNVEATKPAARHSAPSSRHTPYTRPKPKASFTHKHRTSRFSG